MKRMTPNSNKWKNFYPYLILSLLTLFFCWLLCLQYGIFGSKIDWINQHSVLPDYFRRHFYETGKLFPEFAANIGGGQNIYNFSYYGLYSPILLISYLFPFVPMSYYMMFAGIATCLAGVLLLYHWLRTRNISKIICFGSALIYLLAGPLIFHSYDQIMFVNYLPFLCMGLIGMDRHFEKKKSGLLMLSVCLMVLTSFYFSVCGLIVLGLYGLFHCMQGVDNKSITSFGEFCKRLFAFIFPMFVGVLMSGILLIPTAMALLGRGGSRESVAFLSLFKPNFSYMQITYSAYGIGLSALAVVVLIAGLFSKKWSVRILHLGTLLVLTIPIFSYLLNGGLYIRDKVMIPFLPLFCFMIASYLQYLKEKSEPSKIDILPYLCALILLIINVRTIKLHYWILLLLDLTFMFGAYCFYCRKKKTIQFLALSVTFLLIFEVAVHKDEMKMLDYESFAAYTNSELESIIRKTAREETGFYRFEQYGDDSANAANLNRIWDMNQYSSSFYSSTYNKDYMAFRRDVFHLDQPFRNYLMQAEALNPVFQKLMGVKYVASAIDVSGYSVSDKSDTASVWKREGTAPIIYGTNTTISQKSYEELEFPLSQLAFADYAVIDTDETSDISVLYQENVRAAEFEIPTKYHSQKDKSIYVPVHPQEGENLLFIKFDVANKTSDDILIRIGKMRNKLSSAGHIYYNENENFVFVLNLDTNQTELPVELSAGDYELSNVECYYVKCDLSDTGLYESTFHLDKKKSKDNLFSGSINQKSAGWLITSIPYDENFEILIDGKEVNCEKVNTAFLGCKISEGEHQVDILYHAPGVTSGKIVSLTGIGTFALITAMPYIKKKKDEL